MINNNMPYFFNNVNNIDFIKQGEKRRLNKKANGLGFFVFAYFMTMTITSTVLVAVLEFVFNDLETLLQGGPLFHLFQIFVSVFAAFIPSLLYIVFSKSDINEVVCCKYVRLSVLIPIIFVGMGVSMLANYASEILSQNFSIFGLENTIDFNAASNSLFSNILYVISTALVPALAEELAFRGIVMGSLRKYGDTFAIIASAVLFGAMHGNIVQIPFAFILGLIFAFVDCKTNSIIPSVIIHFINNFYAVIMDILQNESIIPDREFYIVYLACTVAFCLMGLLSFVYLIRKDKNYFKMSDQKDINNLYAKNLTLKEKNKSFFLSPGVIVCLSLFVIETIFNLGLM